MAEGLGARQIDTVNMANGNLLVKIPLFSFPQRGGLALSYSLIYNAKHYTNKTICDPLGDCTLYSVLTPGTLNPVGAVVGPDYGYATDVAIVQPTKGQNPILDLYDVRDAYGSRHPLAQTPGGTYESVDATGFSYNTTSSTIIDPKGTRNSTEDANGNQLVFNSSNQMVDTLGRIPVTGTSTTDYSKCTGSLPISSAALLTRLAPNNSTVSYTECFVTISVDLHP